MKNYSIDDVKQKFKKGTIVKLDSNNEATICTDLIKSNDFYVIFADLMQSKVDGVGACFSTGKMFNGVGIIFRNEKTLREEYGLTSDEIFTIYCHEMGHCFSPNQSFRDKPLTEEERIMREIDCDTFAIEKCGASPDVLKSALEKTYAYDLRVLGNIPNLPQEIIDGNIKSITSRIENAERLIQQRNCKPIQRTQTREQKEQEILKKAKRKQRLTEEISRYDQEIEALRKKEKQLLKEREGLQSELRNLEE